MVKSPAATLGPSAFEPRQTPPAGGLCSTVALPLSEQFQGSFRAVSGRFQGGFRAVSDFFSFN